MQNPGPRNNHLLLFSVALLPDRLAHDRPPRLLSTFPMGEYAVELIIDPEFLVQADLQTTVDALLSPSTDRAQPSEPEPGDIVREDYAKAPISQIEQSCHLSPHQKWENVTTNDAFKFAITPLSNISSARQETIGNHLMHKVPDKDYSENDKIRESTLEAERNERIIRCNKCT